MKRITTIIVLILLINFHAFTCDCKDLWPLENIRQLNYDNSELVFLGELIDFEETNYTYTFRIIELFKGNYKESIIKGKCFDSCSAFPTEKSRWIVYADFQENNYIDISTCSASRSELFPYCSSHQLPEPPKPHMTKKEMKKYEQKTKVRFDEAKFEWENEIVLLRERVTK